MNRILTATCSIICILCVACVSAKERYEEGQRAEASGQFSHAAGLYLDSLQRDAQYAAARIGLERTGVKAVAEHFRLAQRFEASGRLAEAEAQFQLADDLMGSAAGLSVPIDAPGGYAQRRADVLTAVTDQLLNEGDRYLSKREWTSAAREYSAAAKRPACTPQQLKRAQEGCYASWLAAAGESLDKGRFDDSDIHVAKAMSIYGASSIESQSARDMKRAISDARYRDMLLQANQRIEAGRFQSAYIVVQDALEIYGVDAQSTAEARALRDRIIELGAVSVAVMPVWPSPRIKHVPAGVLGAIDDRLEDQYWSAPPLFIRLREERVVRRELRAAECERQVLTNEEAIAIGQSLGVDYVVLPVMTRCDLDRQELALGYMVQLTNGSAAELKVHNRRTLRLVCDYRILCIADGTTLAEGVIETESARNHRHAPPDLNVNPKDLDLTKRDMGIRGSGGFRLRTNFALPALTQRR